MSEPKLPQRAGAEDSGAARFGKLVDFFRPVRWACPNEGRLAEFVDSALPEALRSRLEYHLSRCHRCRVLLSDVIKAERDFDPMFPTPALMQRAEAFNQRNSTRWRSMGVPLGAFAMAAIIIVSVILFLRKPRELAHSFTPTVTSPASANVEHGATAPVSPPPDVERKAVAREVLPIVLFPRAHSVVTDQSLRIRWLPMPGSPLYSVTLVTSNGDLVWEGESEAASLEVPPDVSLKDGAYFVWIVASTTDGRTLKSKPVRFQIKR